MKSLPVEYTSEAKADLFSLYDYLVNEAGAQIAIGYIERIEKFCDGLSYGSKRGSLRSEIREGLRVIGFERKTNIAFVVEAERVVILRIAHGGKDWQAPLNS